MVNEHTATITGNEYVEYLKLKNKKINYEKELKRIESENKCTVNIAYKYHFSRGAINTITEYHTSTEDKPTKLITKTLKVISDHLEPLFEENRKVEKLEYSNTSLRNEITILKRVIEKFQYNDFIESNPCDLPENKLTESEERNRVLKIAVTGILSGILLTTAAMFIL